jgi:hypothetical protein
MALRHWDGFSAYNELVELDQLYVREGSSVNIAVLPNGGPSNLGAVRIGGVNLSNAGFYRTITSSSTVIFGQHFNWLAYNSSAATSDMIFKLAAGGSEQVSVWIYSDGRLWVRNSSFQEVFDSSDPTHSPDGLTVNYLTPGNEYRIAIRCVISATVGELEIWVNEKRWCNRIGLDTGSSSITRVHWGTAYSGSGASYEISEIYVFDGTGTFNNAILISWKAQLLLPTSDDVAAFTRLSGAANYEMVDDATPHDADATRNSSTGNAQIDRFATTNTLVGSNSQIHAANVINIAHRDSGAQNFRNTIKHSASIANGADAALGEGDYRPVIQVFETNPSTSAQWTKAQIEAATFGYESRA